MKIIKKDVHSLDWSCMIDHHLFAQLYIGGEGNER